jgi:Tfp pilus assembly protein PilF
LTAVLIAPIVVLNIGAGLYYASRPPAVVAHYRLPVLSDSASQFVTKITVNVENHGEKAFMPRFAVQRDPNRQALPWKIITGPATLRPGQSADYAIDAENFAVTSFTPDTGGQIVVTDAGGDYTYRAVVNVAAAKSALNPDMIQNAAFQYWSPDGALPQYWSVQPGINLSLDLGVAETEGRTALLLNSASDSADRTVVAPSRLTQTITFPGRFDLWVYPELTSPDPNTGVYGLSINDGVHELWVLFGDSDSEGTLQPGDRTFVYKRAPLHQWSKQTVDLEAYYRHFGWPLPRFSFSERDGLLVMRRLVRLSLLAGSNSDSKTRFLFGAIDQNDGSGNPADDAISHPEEYYLMLGDLYFNQGNPDRAEHAYQQAITFAMKSNAPEPIEASAYYALANISTAAARWQEAAGYYRRALDLHFSPSTFAHRGLAWALFRSGAGGEAQGEILTAWRQSETEGADFSSQESADLYAKLGWITLAEGDSWTAVGAFESAVKLDPSDVYLALGLSTSYAAQGDSAQALATLSDALRRAQRPSATTCADFQRYVTQLGIGSTWSTLEPQCALLPQVPTP